MTTKPRFVLRPAVAAFASMMEAKLREKDPLHDNGSDEEGWSDDSVEYLLARLGQETRELRRAVMGSDSVKIGEEAADVANYAMMVANVCLALKGVRAAQSAETRLAALKIAVKSTLDDLEDVHRRTQSREDLASHRRLLDALEKA